MEERYGFIPASNLKLKPASIKKQKVLKEPEIIRLGRKQCQSESITKGTAMK